MMPFLLGITTGFDELLPRMGFIRRAVIDVGTNSVKMLIADVDGHSVRPVFEDSEQTRLGQGFYEAHRLAPENIQHTATAVAHYVKVAGEHNAGRVRIIATSAARDAVNQAELVQAIEAASGLPLEIISGQQEANWVYQGVRSDARYLGQRLLILDAGGGSTEFILGETDCPEITHSFPIGSVRLMEALKPSDPPLPAELAACRENVSRFLRDTVRPVIGALLERGGKKPILVGTGGAASILARMEFSLRSYERSAIDGARISLASVTSWVDRLWSLPLAIRRGIVGLPKKRADVILTGAAIYEGVLREFGLPELQTSTRGLRFAAAMSSAEPAVAL